MSKPIYDYKGAILSSVPLFGDIDDSPSGSRIQLLEAALTSRMFDLLRSRIGWDRISQSSDMGYIPEDLRRDYVKRSRIYSCLDSLVQCMSRIWTDFTVGSGLTLKPRTDENSDSYKTARKVWKSKKNRSVFSVVGQRKLNDVFVSSGELALTIWGKGEGALVRAMDPLNIMEIKSDPDDVNSHWWYVRNTSITGKTVAYRDAYAENPSESVLPVDCSVEEDVVMYFVSINTLSQRGNPQFMSGLDWAKAHNSFMHDRAAIEAALSLIAVDEKVKGGASAVNARIAAEASSLSSSDYETNPPPAAGSTFIHNEGIERKAVRIDTGSDSAQTDGAMLSNMVGVGSMIYPEMLGAINAAGIVLRVPTIKALRAHQSIVCSVFTDIIELIIGEEDSDIAFDVPDIIDKDLARILAALAKVLIQMPELAGNDEVRRWMLSAIGIDDPQAVIEDLKKNPPPVVDNPFPGRPDPTGRGIKRVIASKSDSDIAEAVTNGVLAIRNMRRIIEDGDDGNGR